MVYACNVVSSEAWHSEQCPESLVHTLVFDVNDVKEMELDILRREIWGVAPLRSDKCDKTVAELHSVAPAQNQKRLRSSLTAQRQPDRTSPEP